MYNIYITYQREGSPLHLNITLILQIDMIDSESSLTGGISLDRYFEIELLSKRNSVMTERIANLLEQYPDESFFFAFGAG